MTPKQYTVIHGHSWRRGPGAAQIILTVLISVGAQLTRGAVVIVERSRLRVRELPIRSQS
jgi:hypothetical protein